VLSAAISEPSSWRAAQHLDAWLKSRNLVGLAASDTDGHTAHPRWRRTQRRRRPCGRRAFRSCRAEGQCRQWPGLDGMIWRSRSVVGQSYRWEETPWVLGPGYGTRRRTASIGRRRLRRQAQHPALPCQCGARVTVVRPPPPPARFWRTSRRNFSRQRSRRSGGDRQLCRPTIQKLLAAEIPLFGICLGHQLLAARAGRRTKKMHLAIAAQSSGQGSHHRQGGDHQPEPRLRRACGVAGPWASPSPCFAVRRFQRRPRHLTASRCSRCSTTPKPLQARRTVTICERFAAFDREIQSSKQVTTEAQRHREERMIDPRDVSASK